MKDYVFWLNGESAVAAVEWHIARLAANRAIWGKANSENRHPNHEIVSKASGVVLLSDKRSVHHASQYVTPGPVSVWAKGRRLPIDTSRVDGIGLFPWKQNFAERVHRVQFIDFFGAHFTDHLGNFDVGEFFGPERPKPRSRNVKMNLPSYPDSSQGSASISEGIVEAGACFAIPVHLEWSCHAYIKDVNPRSFGKLQLIGGGLGGNGSSIRTFPGFFQRSVQGPQATKCDQAPNDRDSIQPTLGFDLPLPVIALVIAPLFLAALYLSERGCTTGNLTLWLGGWILAVVTGAQLLLARLPFLFHMAEIVTQKHLTGYHYCNTLSPIDKRSTSMANVLSKDKQIAVIGALVEGSIPTRREPTPGATIRMLRRGGPSPSYIYRQ